MLPSNHSVSSILQQKGVNRCVPKSRTLSYLATHRQNRTLRSALPPRHDHGATILETRASGYE